MGEKLFKLKEVKEFINSLSDECLEYVVVNSDILSIDNDELKRRDFETTIVFIDDVNKKFVVGYEQLNKNNILDLQF